MCVRVCACERVQEKGGGGVEREILQQMPVCSRCANYAAGNGSSHKGAFTSNYLLLNRQVEAKCSQRLVRQGHAQPLRTVGPFSVGCIRLLAAPRTSCLPSPFLGEVGKNLPTNEKFSLMTSHFTFCRPRLQTGCRRLTCFGGGGGVVFRALVLKMFWASPNYDPPTSSKL